jgi:DNA-binding transcriptional regulator YiaG
VDTTRNWEVNRHAPAPWQWPRIIQFLGYVPFSTDGTLPDQLKTHRRLHGLSQKKLAKLLGVNESTVCH